MERKSKWTSKWKKKEIVVLITLFTLVNFRKLAMDHTAEFTLEEPVPVGSQET